MTIHTFAFPTTIHFGAGARRRLSEFLRAEGVARPLIVTDRGIAALPMLEELQGLLADGVPAVYAGVWGNPTRAQVVAGVEAYRDHGADGVVGFGGGAALDVAKAVALMVHHPGDILDYAWDHPGVRTIEGALPCLAAVPTTSGTGSEVGRSAVIADDRTRIKRIVFSPKLLARAVFADPELTIGLPPDVTAATGMDALTHNVESYLSPVYHPLCDGVALEGTRIAARSLAVAVRDPGNLAARADMMMASMMGAVAFQKDLGAVHSCAHALGTVVDMHHGLANGIMIDHVMGFNIPAAVTKMAELARVCGLEAGTAEAGAQAFVDWLSALKRTVGIPAGLAGRVTAADIPSLLEVALADTCHQTNPRPCQREDFESLFRRAIDT